MFRGQFQYTSFDKRNDFSFNIVKYPDLSGNITLKPSYGVYTSQLVRYCDINQSSSGFVSDVKDMTSCFLKQCFVFLRQLKNFILAFALNICTVRQNLG